MKTKHVIKKTSYDKGGTSLEYCKGSLALSVSGEEFRSTLYQKHLLHLPGGQSLNQGASCPPWHSHIHYKTSVSQKMQLPQPRSVLLSHQNGSFLGF